MFKTIIISMVLAFSLNGCSTPFFKDDLSSILGTEKVVVKDSEHFEEWAGMQGDGIILEIYDLSEKTIEDFQSRASKILPDKIEQNKNWEKYNWNNNPIDTSYNEIIGICLNYLANSKEINAHLKEIKHIMEKRGIYSAFYYESDKENPQHVQLFILDISIGRLYTIDQQI